MLPGYPSMFSRYQGRDVGRGTAAESAGILQQTVMPGGVPVSLQVSGISPAFTAARTVAEIPRECSSAKRRKLPDLDGLRGSLASVVWSQENSCWIPKILLV